MDCLGQKRRKEGNYDSGMRGRHETAVSSIVQCGGRFSWPALLLRAGLRHHHYFPLTMHGGSVDERALEMEGERGVDP